jgi:hypothetical protein
MLFLCEWIYLSNGSSIDSEKEQLLYIKRGNELCNIARRPEALADLTILDIGQSEANVISVDARIPSAS